MASSTLPRPLHILTASVTHSYSIYLTLTVYWLSHGLYCHFYGLKYTLTASVVEPEPEPEP